MPFNIRVFALAQKYDIEPLRIFAKQRFEKLAKADPVGDGFSQAVKLLYEETTDVDSHEKQLREVAVNFAREHYKTLMKEDSGFQAILDEVTGFGADVAAALSVNNANENSERVHSSLNKYMCASCQCVVEMKIPDHRKYLYCLKCGSEFGVSRWEDCIIREE